MKRTTAITVICVLVLCAGVIIAWTYQSRQVTYKNDSTQHIASTTVPAASSTAATTSVRQTTPPASTPEPTGGIRGSVTIGPTCPVERDPPDPACADKPYQASLIVSSTIPGGNGGKLVRTDAAGHFEQKLAPGTYTIRNASESVYPTLAPVTVKVAAGSWTQADLKFDSGIR